MRNFFADELLTQTNALHSLTPIVESGPVELARGDAVQEYYSEGRGVFMDYQPRIFQVLARSRLYREFQGAFEHTAGVCVTFEEAQACLSPRRHPMDSVNLRFPPRELILYGGSDASCQHPQTILLEWAPGIAEGIVSVRVGQQIFGILRTGCIAETKLTPRQLKRLAVSNALTTGAEDDLKVCINMPVMDRSRVTSICKVLIVFAEYLGEMGNRLVLQQSTCEPAIISRAKQFIKLNHRENVMLDDVADYSHVSTFYLCKLFKKITGVNFSEFLTRTRIETAKELLLDRSSRINEVALGSGFQSLTNFNRVFKQFVGRSPRDFRKHTVV